MSFFDKSGFHFKNLAFIHRFKNDGRKQPQRHPTPTNSRQNNRIRG